MRVSARTAAIAVVLAGALAGALPWSAVAPAQVPASGTGRGTLEVIRPLRLAVGSQLAFGRAAGAQGGSVTVAPVLPGTRTGQGVALVPGDATSPFVATVTGEPGRAYRIAVPDRVAATPGGFGVGAFTVVSRTAGSVTPGRPAQLDASGADTLLIGATLTLPRGAKPQAYTAQVPVTIAYE